jgi:hypothetical protein
VVVIDELTQKILADRQRGHLLKCSKGAWTAFVLNIRPNKQLQIVHVLYKTTMNRIKALDNVMAQSTMDHGKRSCSLSDGSDLIQ